jgi:transcriptional regulator with XRE-family HTH domain
MPFNGMPLPGLKEARLRKAMTQAELAKAAGLAASTVGRLETDGPAAPATIRKLAQVLDVEPADLMAPKEHQGKALAAQAA